MTKVIKVTRRNGDVYEVIVDKDFEPPKKLAISTGGIVQYWEGKRSIALRRYVVNAKDGEIVEHINNNKLDCRRVNLKVTNNSCKDNTIVNNPFGKEIIVIRKGEAHKVLIDANTKIPSKLFINKRGYAFFHINGEKILLHRYLMGAVDPSEIVDHIDRNPLNCRTDNLRIVTRKENQYNRKHRGTSKHKDGGWSAWITVNYKSTYLGYFKTEEEAHQAYKEAHIKHRGKYSPYYKEEN